jgi:hypothetical protein
MGQAAVLMCCGLWLNACVAPRDSSVPLGSDESLPGDVATSAALAALFDVKRGLEVVGGPLCAWLRDVVSLD